MLNSLDNSRNRWLALHNSKSSTWEWHSRVFERKYSHIKPRGSSGLVLLMLENPPQYNLHFCRFTLSPVAAEKLWNSSIMTYTELESLLLNKIRSSAKEISVIFSFAHLGWNLKFRCLWIFFRLLCKYSMMRTNKRGEIGSHCLIPLLALTITLLCPYTTYWYDIVEIQVMIQLINL